jgi:hypothetical protein
LSGRRHPLEEIGTSVRPLDLRSILREFVVEIRVESGREGYLESFKTWVQDNVDRLNRLAEIKK